MLTIAKMKKEELEETVALAVACFGADKEAAARVDFSASFADYPMRPSTFVAKENGKIVGAVQSVTGYIGFNLRGFAWVCVLPAHRKQGIGKKLLAHAEQDAIKNHFGGKPGTFLLEANHDPAYYRAQGYSGESTTHAGAPLLVKIFSPG